MIAKAASSVEQALKIKCPVHDSFSIIPPQLQGKWLLVVITTTTYTVNINISIKELYSPLIRHLGTSNRMDIAISVNGIVQVIVDANGRITGDSCNCCRNTGHIISIVNNRTINIS